jgi:hypothetical protein
MLHEAAAMPHETTQFSQIPVKRHECGKIGLRGQNRQPRR